MSNININDAKAAKKDEFYTQITDIEKEMGYYENQFADKTIYCNCDDPTESNFFYFFSYNFEDFKIKKLIATCYKNTDKDLFTENKEDRGLILEYTGDKNGNNLPDPEEIGIKKLKGDGDFRSQECIEFLKEADIVITNPPFSLFRQYVSQLMEYKKKFIILGNMNAISYKEIFPLIKENKMWVGPSISSGDREFGVPDDYPLQAAGKRVDKDGKKFIKVKGVRWFTNLDIDKRYEDLIMVKNYNEKDYPKYDNYDAIEVSEVKNIPNNYDGIMGVPLSFLDKHNPNQFELIGISRSFDESPAMKKLKTDNKNRHASIIRGKEKYVRLFIKRKK